MKAIDYEYLCFTGEKTKSNKFEYKQYHTMSWKWESVLLSMNMDFLNYSLIFLAEFPLWPVNWNRCNKNFKYLNKLPHSWKNISISNLFPVIDWYLEMEGLPRWCSGKESACQFRRRKRWGFDPWMGKIPYSRICNPLQYSWPGKSHGQRSLG